MRLASPIVAILVSCLGGFGWSYFAVDGWPAKFEQHAEVGPWIFVVPGIATLLVALLSVSYQAVRAVASDPVKSLRHEHVLRLSQTMAPGG